eukprot:7595098-Prorocentrum_lima.AAC.1
MTSSLVGSEMCIRDRQKYTRQLIGSSPATARRDRETCRTTPPTALTIPVSYTHLTLPTICSV